MSSLWAPTGPDTASARSSGAIEAHGELHGSSLVLDPKPIGSSRFGWTHGPEDMPERMSAPDRMSEQMPDRMPD